jgi:ABC-type lipoprotein export system ATPase subunit
MVFLELNDVIKLYRPENDSLQVPALRGVSLKLEENSLCSLIGPSGAGKSTLLKILAGLEQPSSGTIHIDGVGYLNKLSSKKIRKYRQEVIGFMYQHPENNLLSKMSLIDNVTLPMKILGKLSHQQQKNRAIELLTLLGLEKRYKQKLHQISGGEAQRCAIAVALANNPKLILADEPTGELDTENMYSVLEYFKNLNETLGTSFIVVTHDERFSNLSENTFRLKDGRIMGFHRQVQENHLTNERENIYLLDNFGNLSIPDEIRKELSMGSEVRLRVNSEKKLLEVIPIHK